MADEHAKTYWNGEETIAVRGTAVVADNGQFPHYWAAQEGIVGERIPVVLVDYHHQVSFLDDRTGWGWHKVTTGLGCPSIGHKDVQVRRDSFRQTRPYPDSNDELHAALAPEPMPELTRDVLVSLCTDGVVPQDKWRNRDSASAQRQLGIARALLAAGCNFHVIKRGGMASDGKTLWVEITWHGFSYFEYGSDATEADTFYIPTRARLDAYPGEDWY